MSPDAFLILRAEHSSLAQRISEKIEQADLQVSVATALDDPNDLDQREIIEAAYRYARCVVYVEPQDEVIPWIQSDASRTQRIYIVNVDEVSDQVRILSVPKRHVVNNYYTFSGAIAELIGLIKAEPERELPNGPLPDLVSMSEPPPTPTYDPVHTPATDVPTSELDPVYPPEPDDLTESERLRGLRKRIEMLKETTTRSEDGSSLAILVITQGAERDTIYITHSPFVVGRAIESGSDYAIHVDYVSRRHFAIYLEHGDFLVEDLNSSNGTWVDGRRLERGGRQVLHPGSEIGVMNRLTLTFQTNPDH